MLSGHASMPAETFVSESREIQRIIPIKGLSSHTEWETRVTTAINSYQLPGDTERGVFIVPVSGGADSSVLAILLRTLYPRVSFHYVYTETFADDSGVTLTLEQLEAYLERPITRILPDKGLYELIDSYGGFLPSASKRYCTRELKAVPFEPWLDQFHGRKKYIFVGIRADEDFRIAFSMPDSESVFPLLEMGLNRKDVFRILTQTIGVPRYYMRRSRSGCHSCFFQRRYELVGLLQQEPEQFAVGAKYEKLSESDRARHQPAPALWTDSGISANWLGLPMPVSAKVRTTKLKNRMRSQTTLFGDTGIFVGVEYFFDSMFAFGGGDFTFHRRIVSYSPIYSGIKSQLDDRYQHILSTSEVYEMEEEDVPHQVKFAIFYVELPATVFDPQGPERGSYTWQQGTSYNQLRHIIQWVTRALQAENMRIEAAATAHPMSVVHEWAESAKVGLASLEHEVGRVVSSEWYTPRSDKKSLSPESEAKLLPCPMCSI